MRKHNLNNRQTRLKMLPIIAAVASIVDIKKLNSAMMRLPYKLKRFSEIKMISLKKLNTNLSR